MEVHTSTAQAAQDVTLEVHTRGPEVFRMKRSQLVTLLRAQVGQAEPQAVEVRWHPEATELERIALYSLNRNNVGYVFKRGSDA